MSFRWRQPLGELRLVVWHVLEEGRLTVHLPFDDDVISPAWVAGAVEHALDEGWRPHEHMTHALTDDEWHAIRGYTISYPDGPRPTGVLVGAPSPAGPMLQVTYRPPQRSPIVVTVWVGARTMVRLDAIEDDTPFVVDNPLEDESVEDLLVSVRAALPVSAEPGGRVCPVTVVLVDGRGRWEGLSDATRARGRTRLATVGLWRLGMVALASSTAAIEALQSLHRWVVPEEPPFVVDRAARRIVVFGTPDAVELAGVLDELPGPWTVDARRMPHLTGDPVRLRRILKRSRTSFVWLGDSYRLHEQVYLGLRVAATERGAVRLLEEGAHELLEKALLATMDPRWVVRAGEELTHRRPDRRAAAYDEVERWLGPSWRRWSGGSVAGWRFTDRFEGWHDGLPDAGLVLSVRRFWVRTRNGVVFTAP